MNKIPSYTKILTLGSHKTERIFNGSVIIQEKIDGSQFKWTLDEHGELLFSSKSREIIPVLSEGTLENVQKLFVPAIQYLMSIKSKIKDFPPNTFFYGETLCRPKHNVLKYDRVPKNNIVLFDVFQSDGGFVNRPYLESVAKHLAIDIVPELYRGKANVDKLKELLDTESYLGGQKIEGVVIKNYNEILDLYGHIFPLFCKYVRESFKEVHQKEWQAKKDKTSVQTYIDSFKSIARWEKAIIHLRERGEIEQSPRDIGKIILEVKKDIKEEEVDNIKNFLYNRYINEILRKSVYGLPEFYKNKLLEGVEE